jgi:chemotaxis response regulator CheB
MRVLLFAEPSMFNEGIEAMLRQEPGLEIVGREEDPQEALKLIKEVSPDVILVADGEAAAVLASELMRMVRQGFRMRMVEVHLATNTLCVYRGEQQRIREAGELVETVRHICEELTGDAQGPLTPAMGQLLT